MKKTLALVSFIDTASEGLNVEGPAGFRENFYELPNKTARCNLAWLPVFRRFQYRNLSQKTIKQHLPAALKSQKKIKNVRFIGAE